MAKLKIFVRGRSLDTAFAYRLEGDLQQERRNAIMRA